METDQKAGLRKVELRSFVVQMVAVAGLLLALGGTASAANFCMTLNSDAFVGIGMSIPGKGTCKTGALISPDLIGFLGTGSLCTSSDNTTVLINFSDGFVDVPEVFVGSFSKSSLTGSGNDCVPTTCSPFTITVAKCSPAKQPIPAVSADSPKNTRTFSTVP
jgi:hypothetical protein